ncbi:MAG: hypothetical protein A3F82_10230 [Deltaproteobacteria bacterium RIFCSPLOWO2_12_FULL_44_12]|nr:MAG: hypothetical protein A2712_00100 [Deltaproteobacteria bacterium RIFCSPHIGHO2_01_FULL_43_49]OGQ15821.1 MAG: hypothetical protein A3D22_02750 [Deltaproteobacteria bacterium RIFCSPHIGHO2_02_FULL_44_53]OGQ28775.1 MAG: hypothetical protein A3D98_01080 [Deltaproteobacteria bacterium RIFCSPHIGHO2_12_FULL_44_21]OGQ32095.1 MAG: hypothetical protein A2979_03205 [Deltaproteobacteria bacterium RIFCSPLOWO2_01_FULL_45_74]OGQ70467.1 MAG: hypothetical protein A3F82_10230 [Deltaproteobacteria bacterium 
MALLLIELQPFGKLQVSVVQILVSAQKLLLSKQLPSPFLLQVPQPSSVHGWPIILGSAGGGVGQLAAGKPKMFVVMTQSCVQGLPSPAPQ